MPQQQRAWLAVRRDFGFGLPPVFGRSGNGESRWNRFLQALLVLVSFFSETATCKTGGLVCSFALGGLRHVSPGPPRFALSRSPKGCGRERNHFILPETLSTSIWRNVCCGEA